MAIGIFKRFVSLGAAMAAVASVSGCVSHSYGTPLDPNKVNEIKKHVTTRAQVEATFGTPTHVSMMGEGRRTIIYSHTDTDAHAKATSYIPIVGLFAGGATGEQHIQTLQITLDKDGVVEDFEFNNNTKNIDSTGGVYGNHTEVTDVPTAPPPAK